jgi:hypothetical protein
MFYANILTLSNFRSTITALKYGGTEVSMNHVYWLYWCTNLASAILHIACHLAEASIMNPSGMPTDHGSWYSRRTYRLLHAGFLLSLPFDLEDGEDICLRNVG